ncbi:MAG: tetratricopeptide repeat protein [Candidatus Kapabacteria bacterium]|nr:tetratricopeptide repeat protein [Candidatus Kapabacteria bacterium]
MSRVQTKNSLLTHCYQGSAPVVFFTGEAGMGKSTLLRSIKSEVQAKDPTICIADVDCSAPLAGVDVGAVEALYPWVQLMRELATEAPTSQTKKLVADLARAWIKFVPIIGDLIESTVDTVSIVKQHRASSTAHTEPSSSKEHIFHQCIGFFKALADKGRVVLIIDDAHWADDSTLNLLFALARASSGNITCVVAYRPDDVRTSRLGREHALLHIKRELERYNLCTEVELPPMTAEELAANFGSSDVSTDGLHRFSGGNPFLAQGYVQGSNKSQAQTSIRAVIAEKLSRLEPELKGLLEMASVEGETFTSLVLRTMSPLPQLQIAQLLRKAEQDHMIVRSLGKRAWYTTETQTYEFVNDAIHIAIENEIGEEEREILHAAVADVLRSECELAQNNDRGAQHIMAKLAVHTERGGDNREAVETWLAVAEHAWSLFAEQESRRAIAEALRISDGETKSTSIQILRGRVLCLSGMIDLFQRRVPEAVVSLDEAILLARKSADVKLEITALCRRATVANVAGDPEGIHRYATEALRLAQESKYIAGELAAFSMLGMWNESKGDLDAAESYFEKSLELAESIGERNRKANALVNIGRIRVHRNDLAAAIPVCLEAAEIFESLSMWDGMARALNNTGIAYAEGAQYHDATLVYGRALELHERIGDVVGGSSLRTNMAQLHMRQGDLLTASQLIDVSIAMKRTLDDGYGLAIALYTRGLIELENKNRFGARISLEEARTIAHEIQELLVLEEIERQIALIEISD